jgi:hypothetical protein
MYMRQSFQPIPKGYRVGEAAAAIHTSRRFLELEMERGNLPVVRLATRCVRIRPEDLDAYLRRFLFTGPRASAKRVEEPDR